jgi:hypothetical protein
MKPTLAELLGAAQEMQRYGDHWLLEASELSEAIGRAIASDATQLNAIRSAVQHTAASVECDLIVGASAAAGHVVDGLTADVADPKRALLFELVRVTGATITQSLGELRHLEVIPAVLVDLHPSSGTGQPSPISVRVPEFGGS